MNCINALHMISKKLQISSKLLTFVILFGISSRDFLYSVLIIKNISLENLYLKLFCYIAHFETRV